jgi:hypothetical protein
MTRLCAAPGCGRLLVRREAEQRINFEKRKTCGAACANRLRGLGRRHFGPNAKEARRYRAPLAERGVPPDYYAHGAVVEPAERPWFVAARPWVDAGLGMSSMGECEAW